MTTKPYISDTNFHENWGLRVCSDGSLFTFDDVRNERLEHVWTIVESGEDSDLNWYAAPGFHVVNKLGYVTTEKPWTDEALDAIYFLDDFEREDVEAESDEGEAV